MAKKKESTEIPIRTAEERESVAAAEAEAKELEEAGDQEVGINEPPVSAETDETETDPASEPESDYVAQVESLSREKNSLYDQLLRRQAEFENFRKRVERDRTELLQRTRAEVMLEMLPVLDNFERALASLEQDGIDAEALRHGVELIHKQLRDALTKMGLQPVESVGKTFDPNLHEALTLEPSDEHNENTIIAEFQRGYKLGDRLLRPAKVKVASGPQS